MYSILKGEPEMSTELDEASLYELAPDQPVEISYNAKVPIETFDLVIIDEAQDHYELIYSGWNGPYRIHGSVLHLDIRDGKVWIQHDGTEEGVAEKLVSAGIPRECIVLAFKAPEIRPHTGFASA